MARLLHEYPEVFDAYWAAVMGRIAAQGGKEGFRERRERTRAERIRRLASR